MDSTLIESGIAYEYTKTAYWLFLEKQAEESIKLENDVARQYAKMLSDIYGNKRSTQCPESQS